jgi:hypothetical protein
MFFLRLMPIFLKASLMFCCLTKSPHNPRHLPWRQISMLLHKLTKPFPVGDFMTTALLELHDRSKVTRFLF